MSAQRPSGQTRARTKVLSTNARAVVFTVDVLLALSVPEAAAVAEAAAAAEAELAAAALA